MTRRIAFVVAIATLAFGTTFANPSSSSCQRWYEWSTDGVFDGHTFSGSVPRGTDNHMSYFDTPLFLSPNVTETKVAGRIMGGFWPSGRGGSFLASGFWNFNFFDENEASSTWLSANLGFGDENSTVKAPNVVTGGTGRYVGFVGSLETKVINSDPLVIQYDLCPSQYVIDDVTECKEVFEWSLSGTRTINNSSFSGSVPFPSNTSYGEVANTPTFPNANLTPSEVNGRLVAQFFFDRITTASGSFNFGTFPAGNDTDTDDWVSVNFGFGPLDTSLDGSFTRGTPNIVVGGTGKYSGFVGSMRDKAVSTDPNPLVFLYEICPSEETEPSPDVMESCFSVYEWSTSRRSNFSGYQFAGTALYEEGDEHTGVFDTPFFASPDVENSEVMGRVIGYYIPNGRGAASGLWNFAFFEKGSEDSENWIAASLGFDDDDTATSPNVITGGSGAFSGFTGTIEQQIVSFDPFVIEWIICPPIRDDSGDSANSSDSSGGSSFTVWTFEVISGLACMMQLVLLLC